MSIPLSKLEKFFYVDKLIIHSLDLALYQASVVVDGKAQFITDDNGIFLRAHSLIEMQNKCKNIKANKPRSCHIDQQTQRPIARYTSCPVLRTFYLAQIL